MPKSKTTISIALGLSLILLSGCASDSPSATASATPSESQSETSEAVEVDEGLFDVEVTVPASFFEEETEAEMQARAEESGFTSAKLNDDGSITYQMSKRVYEKVLSDFKTSLNETIQQTVDEQPGIFKSVSYNAKVTEFEVVVDRGAFESDFAAAFVGFSFGIGGMYYQVFDGVAEDQRKVLITYIDESTGEEFRSVTFPLSD
jgi:hypothetical protein